MLSRYRLEVFGLRWDTVTGSCYHGTCLMYLVHDRIQWLTRFFALCARRIWSQSYPEADMDWIHLAVNRIPVAESYRYGTDLTSRVKVSYLCYMNSSSLAGSFPPF
jgi:hypothetical protein